MNSLFSRNSTSLTSPLSEEKSGTMEQFLLGIVLVLAVYITLLFIEIISKYIKRIAMDRTELLANTYMMDNKSIVIPQDPNLKESKPVSLSQNERTGVEFTYSFYLNIQPSSFRQEYGLLHLFHKGYTNQFPLMAPGVYLRSDKNTLRVYMNTYKTWNNYMEVDNLPIGKWVHIAIMCKENAMEIYINGNLSRKMSFDGYAPYQNCQDIHCFNQRRITLRKSSTPSVDEQGFDVFGAAKGMMSRLHYFSYALSYSEIQKLMDEGPSSKLDSETLNDIPPYLSDNWWHTNTSA